MVLSNRVVILRTFFTLVVSTGLSLVVAEIATRIINFRTPLYAVEMARYGALLKMPDPKEEIGHVHRPHTQANLMGVNITINSHGMRGPELDLSQPDSRILVMGSSVTMGWGVEWNDVFTVVAERELKTSGHQVINAGIGNYSTEQQWQLYRRLAPLVSPSMVVLHYFLLDVEPRRESPGHPIFYYSQLAPWLYDWGSGVVFFLKGKDLTGYYHSLYTPTHGRWQTTLRTIRSFQEDAEQHHIPFAVLVTPDFHRLSPNSDSSRICQFIQTELTQHQIATYNLAPDFASIYADREKELWVASDDAHPNAIGHQIMAKALKAISYPLKLEINEGVANAD